MIKTFLCFLMLVFYVNANSLYTDDVTDVIASPTNQLNQSDYDYSSDTTKLEQGLSKSLDLYMNNIFKLSQLTHDLATITNESLVYSDINRLEQISNQLIRILDKKNLNFSFNSPPSLSKLQTTYQKAVFKFYAISPYIPYLLTYHQEKTNYYIDYIDRITAQLSDSMTELLAANKQLNLGPQSTLPFSPQSPQQLSFALENQMTQSFLGMMGTGGSSSGDMMPFAELSTPPNADLFNQGGASNMMPAVGTPNGMPLQMMNFMPSF